MGVINLAPYFKIMDNIRKVLRLLEEAVLKEYDREKKYFSHIKDLDVPRPQFRPTISTENMGSNAGAKKWDLYIQDQCKDVLVDKYGYERGQKLFDGLLNANGGAYYQAGNKIANEKLAMCKSLGIELSDYFDRSYYDIWQQWSGKSSASKKPVSTTVTSSKPIDTSINLPKSVTQTVTKNMPTSQARTANVTFDDKDLMRIKDIIKKSAGNSSKEIQLAQTMANSITDKDKLVRRFKAAKELNQFDVAKVFYNKAKQLGLVESKKKNEELNEGWKEILVAGAIALAGLHPTKSSANTGLDTKTSTESQIKTEFQINFGGVFQSGKYKLDSSMKKEIELKLKDILLQLSKYSTSNINITITAGESQVTNKDAETGESLGKGVLATRRAEVIKMVLADLLEEAKSQKLFSGNFVINVNAPIIGTTPYQKGNNPADERYTKEQFVKADFKVAGIAIKKTEQEDKSFSNYAKRGEAVYSADKKLLGFIYYNSVASVNKNDAGIKNTGDEDVVLRFVKPETSTLSGEAYKIPKSWWNNRQGSSNILSSSDFNKLSQFK